MSTQLAKNSLKKVYHSVTPKRRRRINLQNPGPIRNVRMKKNLNSLKFNGPSHMSLMDVKAGRGREKRSVSHQLEEARNRVSETIIKRKKKSKEDDSFAELLRSRTMKKDRKMMKTKSIKTKKREYSGQRRKLDQKTPSRFRVERTNHRKISLPSKKDGANKRSQAKNISSIGKFEFKEYKLRFKQLKTDPIEDFNNNSKNGLKKVNGSKIKLKQEGNKEEKRKHTQFTDENQLERPLLSKKLKIKGLKEIKKYDKVKGKIKSDKEETNLPEDLKNQSFFFELNGRRKNRTKKVMDHQLMEEKDTDKPLSNGYVQYQKSISKSFIDIYTKLLNSKMQVNFENKIRKSKSGIQMFPEGKIEFN